MGQIRYIVPRSALLRAHYSLIASKRNPNKRKNCGQFFYLHGGQYYSYCDNPLADVPGKTCRDIGLCRRYANKCNSDHVWKAYNRAYKSHYARYMKKKMTVAAF